MWRNPTVHNVLQTNGETIGGDGDGGGDSRKGGERGSKLTRNDYFDGRNIYEYKSENSFKKQTHSGYTLPPLSLSSSLSPIKMKYLDDNSERSTKRENTVLDFRQKSFLKHDLNDLLKVDNIKLQNVTPEGHYGHEIRLNDLSSKSLLQRNRRETRPKLKYMTQKRKFSSNAT